MSICLIVYDVVFVYIIYHTCINLRHQTNSKQISTNTLTYFVLVLLCSTIDIHIYVRNICMQGVVSRTMIVERRVWRYQRGRKIVNQRQKKKTEYNYRLNISNNTKKKDKRVVLRKGSNSCFTSCARHVIVVISHALYLSV